ncbi:MAG: hypothetical protein WBA89_00795 [Microcoleus sp.]
MTLFLARNLPSRAIELPANQGSWDENLTCARQWMCGVFFIEAQLQ